MQDIVTTINWIMAVMIGVLTFVVCRRVLKACPMLDHSVVAVCVGCLTTLSLGERGVGGGLLLPYAALGLTLLFVFLLLPFLKEKEPPKKDKPAIMPPPDDEKEDPWEKELRRRNGGTRRVMR